MPAHALCFVLETKLLQNPQDRWEHQQGNEQNQLISTDSPLTLQGTPVTIHPAPHLLPELQAVSQVAQQDDPREGQLSNCKHQCRSHVGPRDQGQCHQALADHGGRVDTRPPAKLQARAGYDVQRLATQLYHRSHTCRVGDKSDAGSGPARFASRSRVSHRATQN